MKFPAQASLMRTCRAAQALVATFLLAFVAGCASPGPPLPPSLHLPRVVNDLTALRTGNTVELSWTTPSRTTDDLDLPDTKGALTALICRQTGNASAANCLPVARISVKPGPSHQTDPLPAALTQAPMQLLSYRIRLLNANGRSAGASRAAFSVSGPAPSPVEQLRATVARYGVVLEWTATADAVPVDLDRTWIAGPSLPATKITSKSATKTTSKTASKPAQKPESLFNPQQAGPAEVHLEARNQPADTGGTVDRGVQKSATYRYTARRIRTVSLAGHTLELCSAPSQAVTVVVNDTFPPAIPTGLAAIPGNATIDLSWEPVPDADTLGYFVYRQQAAPGSPAGQPIRLNATPVTGPAYSDRTALPGQSYLYRVTAIDTSGNESAPSAPVEQAVPEP